MEKYSVMISCLGINFCRHTTKGKNGPSSNYARKSSTERKRKSLPFITDSLSWVCLKMVDLRSRTIQYRDTLSHTQTQNGGKRRFELWWKKTQMMKKKRNQRIKSLNGGNQWKNYIERKCSLLLSSFSETVLRNFRGNIYILRANKFFPCVSL